MVPVFPHPSSENQYLENHASLLLRSYRQLTGTDLLPADLTPAQASESLFRAPFVVLSHDNREDPVFTYGNETALRLFELDWSALVRMPSRFSAEAPNREERARLLLEVSRKGFIHNYEGVRISRKGVRFRVRNAVVWNLLDGSGAKVGQAATFSQWDMLEAP